jgi:hypothetical protein
MRTLNRTALLRTCTLLAAFGLTALGAVAQMTPAAPLSLIHTHATAHTRLPNTIADVSVSIQTDGSTVAGVSKALAEQSQQLLTYLRSQHAERLATEQVSVDPKTHTPKGGPDQIVGYSGRSNVTFRAPINEVSDLITNALAHGANTLESVNFQPREEEAEAARRALATEATKTAMAQAEAIAKAVGIRVASIHEITVDPNGGYSPIRPMMAMAQRMSVGGPLAKIDTEAGEQEVSITVNLDVNIGQ